MKANSRVCWEGGRQEVTSGVGGAGLEERGSSGGHRKGCSRQWNSKCRGSVSPTRREPRVCLQGSEYLGNMDVCFPNSHGAGWRLKPVIVAPQEDSV
jgi:hypothetical protein